MKNDPHQLDLIKPAIFLTIFLILLGVVLFWLNGLDKQRKAAVYNQYKAETDKFIAKNKTGLIDIFANLKDKEPCFDYNNCPQTLLIQDQINQTISHDLKDWSSTIFIFSGSGDKQINYVRLSGDVVQFSGNTDNISQIQKLLAGETESLPWADYTYDFPGKEVVIPVKDSSGKVVGAIVRGVIEEKSFN